MTHTNEDVMRKIAGLLKLAERAGTPEEAANAAARASKLMELHGIERDAALEHADGKASDEPIEFHVGSGVLDNGVNQGGKVLKYLPNWRWRLARAVMTTHGCAGYITETYLRDEHGKLIRYEVTPGHERNLIGQTIVIVGRPSDVAHVRYLYAYLLTQFEILTAEYGKGKGKAWCNNFRLGLADAVRAEFIKANEKAQEEALKAAATPNVPGETDVVASVPVDPNRALARVKAAIEKRENRQAEAEEVMRKGVKLTSSKASSSASYDPEARAAGRSAASRLALGSEAKASLGAGKRALKG